jgi:hypothetical protein
MEAAWRNLDPVSRCVENTFVPLKKSLPDNLNFRAQLLAKIVEQWRQKSKRDGEQFPAVSDIFDTDIIHGA